MDRQTEEKTDATYCVINNMNIAEHMNGMVYYMWK